MQIITRVLWFFTGAVTLAGLFGLWRQSEALGWGLSLQNLTGDALGRPWVWLALGAWVVSSFLSSRYRGRPAGTSRIPSASRSHVISQPTPQNEADEAVGGTSPVLSARRDEELRRLQLNAFLKGKSPDVPGFFDALLLAATQAGAGDIHLQPSGDQCQVTLRVKGSRNNVAEYPTSVHADVVRRIKVLSGIPPYVADKAQDGSFQAETPLGKIQLRVSVVPSQHGETVALRLAGNAVALDLEGLGFESEDLDTFRHLLQQPQGMIVLTGPTGSGKTTTLYSALSHLHQTRGTTCHLASIEDPVEVELPFVHQMQVDRARQLGFAEALRALLRQDPDILMIGEIRDPETAKVAIQAGLSGHLILTTLHSDSAAGVFPRLIDLGVEPFLAGSATLACVSQRLARRLCEHCRHPRTLTQTQRQQISSYDLPESTTFYTAEGCKHCDHSGVGGRMALFEILTLNPTLRQLVAAKAPTSELQEAARGEGARTLFLSALEAAQKGDIALDEALRIRDLR